jgi:glucose-1-phosphatase
MIKNIEGIRNIIFDLGVVILNIDFQATEREFKRLGFHEFDELYTQARQIGLFDRLEQGEISPDKFRNELRKLIGIAISDVQIDNAWNSMIGEFPLKRIKFLEELKQKYRIFLLSNTNKIHFDFYNEIFRKEFGYNFSELFEKMYLSFEIGMRKPDKRIFEYALKQSRLKPGETLFIDDMLQHVEAAMTCNINSYRLKENEEIYDIFKKK